MKTQFNNASGLTAYALACGYIQQVNAVYEGRAIQVTLWQEHSCYHVRAHDFTVVGRLDWVSEDSLVDARYQYAVMLRRYFGPAIEIVRHDPRYTVEQETRSDGIVKWVPRFRGEPVGYAETKLAAYVVAYTHRNPEPAGVAND